MSDHETFMNKKSKLKETCIQLDLYVHDILLHIKFIINIMLMNQLKEIKK